MAIRKLYTPQQKMEWGKHIVESGKTRQANAQELGLAESQIDTYARAYRIANGLAEYDPNNSTDKKAQAILDRLEGKSPRRRGYKLKNAARKREARELVPHRANGNGNGQTMPMDVSHYINRISELEGERDWLQHQCEVLNKIVMTLGEKL